MTKKRSNCSKHPAREFFESLGQLVFWGCAFGIVMLGLAYFNIPDCVDHEPKSGSTTVVQRADNAQVVGSTPTRTTK